MSNSIQFITHNPKLTTNRPDYITDDILVKLSNQLFRQNSLEDVLEINYDELKKMNSFDIDKKIFDYLKDSGVTLQRVKYHRYFIKTIRWYERNCQQGTYEINMQ